jgi:FkbM family methyltransferase
VKRRPGRVTGSVQDKLQVRLPNGTVCHLTSESMWPLANYLRWEIFNRGRYVHAGFELRPSDTVVDIGGNIGMFVLWAAPQVPQGLIVSVEPNPVSLGCLKLNIERNGLGNVTAMQAAAGSDGGTIELIYHPGWEAMAYDAKVRAPWFYRQSAPARMVRWIIAGLTNRQTPAQPAQRITAPLMSLERIMDDRRIQVVNYLKLDCEGSEFEVLRNVSGTCWARIERAAIEYHEFGRNRRAAELVTILEGNGFKVEVNQSLLEKLAQLFGVSIGEIWAWKPGSDYASPLLSDGYMT